MKRENLQKANDLNKSLEYLESLVDEIRLFQQNIIGQLNMYVRGYGDISLSVSELIIKGGCPETIWNSTLNEFRETILYLLAQQIRILKKELEGC